MPRLIRWITWTLGFTLAFSAILPCAQEGRARVARDRPAEVFRAAGIVVSDATGTPLAQTRVTLVDRDNPRKAPWIITGEDGRFEFRRLSAGKYSLQGARRGYISSAYDQHEQYSTAIITGAKLDTENLVLRLVPAAMISGRVIDESGEPVHHATVHLFRQNRDFGVSRITVSTSSDTTDYRGKYDFWPLRPGVYYVSAAARPWYAVHPPSSPSGGAESSFQSVDPSLDVCYPTTFYQDSNDPNAATPIHISGGDHAEIDIHLNPVPALHLLLHVAAAGQNVFLRPTLQNRVFDSLVEATIDGMRPVSADTYEVSGVPPGRYTVRLRSSTAGEADQVSEMDLSENGQVLNGSPGEPLGSLTLSVKIAGEEKIPGQLSVALRDAHLQSMGVRQPDRNGEAHFESLPAGTYTITASVPGNRYAVSLISSPASEVSKNSFDLAPGATASLSVLLTGGLAKVQGFVKRSGQSAPGVMVVLVPTDAKSNIELFRRDQSDSDGSFTLPDVVPGSYSVIAIENGWDIDWSVPSVLARYTAHGQAVTIGPQTKGSVQLPEPVEVQQR